MSVSWWRRQPIWNHGKEIFKLLRFISAYQEKWKHCMIHKIKIPFKFCLKFSQLLLIPLNEVWLCLYQTRTKENTTTAEEKTWPNQNAPFYTHWVYQGESKKKRTKTGVSCRRLTVWTLTTKRPGFINAGCLWRTQTFISAALIDVDAIGYPVREFPGKSVAPWTNLAAFVRTWQIHTGLIASTTGFSSLAFINVCGGIVKSKSCRHTSTHAHLLNWLH